MVKNEVLYRTLDETKKFQSLLKSRIRFDQVDLPGLPLGHKIKKKKFDSLKKLLESLSGKNWNNDPELEWLVPIFAEYCEEGETAVEENEECECNDMEEVNFI